MSSTLPPTPAGVATLDQAYTWVRGLPHILAAQPHDNGGCRCCAFQAVYGVMADHTAPHGILLLQFTAACPCGDEEFVYHACDCASWSWDGIAASTETLGACGGPTSACADIDVLDELRAHAVSDAAQQQLEVALRAICAAHTCAEARAQAPIHTQN